MHWRLNAKVIKLQSWEAEQAAGPFPREPGRLPYLIYGP